MMLYQMLSLHLLWFLEIYFHFGKLLPWQKEKVLVYVF